MLVGLVGLLPAGGILAQGVEGAEPLPTFLDLGPLLEVGLGAVCGGVGLFQLLLFWRWRGQQDESPLARLWLGLACLDFGLLIVLYDPQTVLFGSVDLESRLAIAVMHLSIPPLMLFLWPFLGRRLDPWQRRYIESQVGLAVVVPLLPGGWSALVAQVLWIWVLPFFAALIYLVAVEALAGNREARILSVGCGAIVVSGSAETILMVTGLGTSEPLPALAFSLFLGSVLFADSERTGQVFSELDVLRQQMDRMVDDRTTELSAANERLQAEIAERQLAEEAMHMLERAVEQSIDGIAVADLAGNMQFINEAWANLHGYEVFELLGYDLTIFHTPEQMRDQVQPLMDRVQKEGAYSAEIEHRRRAGATFPTWQTATCLQDPEGGPIGFVFIVRDITERKNQEEERRRLEERVRQAEKLESLGSLAGGVAHDYNNILTGVLGNVSLALLEAARGSDLFQRLRQIEASAERAAELTDQLLAYAGEEQQSSHTLQLNELVQEHRQVFERTVASTGARLEVHLKNGLPPIQGDPGQVVQAVTNLLTNAADSLAAEGADGAGLIMLRTSVVTAKKSYFEGAILDEDRAEGRYVFFEVSDTGRGMDEETRGRMFEPFFSTKSSGRGMGLAAVLGIVRAHQGNIRVFSQPGRGTTVEVLFPAVEDMVARVEESQAAPTWEGFGTALVVDDEQLVRDVAAKVLQRQGFEVLVAVNGREALDIFVDKKDEIRLVLLDLTMPEMDGETFMQEMGRYPSEAQVLLMSGYREQSATQGLDGEKLAGFLHKPFRPNELLRKVREILD